MNEWAGDTNTSLLSHLWSSATQWTLACFYESSWAVPWICQVRLNGKAVSRFLPRSGFGVSGEPLPQGTSSNDLGMASSYSNRVEKAETTSSIPLCMVSGRAHYCNAIQNLQRERSETGFLALTLVLSVPPFSFSCLLYQLP